MVGELVFDLVGGATGSGAHDAHHATVGCAHPRSGATVEF